jgi:hypothetical protein
MILKMTANSVAGGDRDTNRVAGGDRDTNRVAGRHSLDVQRKKRRNSVSVRNISADIPNRNF